MFQISKIKSLQSQLPCPTKQKQQVQVAAVWWGEDPSPWGSPGQGLGVRPGLRAGLGSSQQLL